MGSSTATRAGKADLVNGWAMRINLRAVTTREFTKFGQGANAGQVIFLAAPNWQWCSPVAIARECPVNIVLQPLTKAAFANVLRVPADLFVFGNHVILERRRRDIPTWLTPINQRGIAAPAVRIAVQVR